MGPLAVRKVLDGHYVWSGFVLAFLADSHYSGGGKSGKSLGLCWLFLPIAIIAVAERAGKVWV